MTVTIVAGVVAMLVLVVLATAGKSANIADWNGRMLNRLDGLNRLFCRRFHRLKSEPLNLPATGGAVVVCNHVSGLDPLLLLASSRRPLRFLIAQSEYNRWWLKWLFDSVECIPVKRSGRVDRSLAAAKSALAKGEVMALFPQGRLVPQGSAPVKLKRGAIYLADLAEVPIIPVRIDGVAAQGKTILAVFIRSRVRIRVAAALPPSLSAEHRQRVIEEFITDTRGSGAGNISTIAE